VTTLPAPLTDSTGTAPNPPLPQIRVWILIALLFIGLPWFLLLLDIQDRQAEFLARDDDQRLEEMKAVLPLLDNGGFAPTLVDIVHETLATIEPDLREDWPEILPRFQRDFPGLASLTVISPIGTPHPDWNQHTLTPAQGELFYDGYFRPFRNLAVIRAHRSELQKIIGPLLDPELLRVNALESTGILDEGAFLFVCRLTSGHLLLTHFHATTATQNHLQTYLARRLRRVYPFYHVSFINTEAIEPPDFSAFGEAADAAGQALARMHSSPETTFAADGFFWGGVRLEGNRIALVLDGRDVRQRPWMARYPVLWSGAVAVLLSLLSGWWGSRFWAMNWSIRRRTLVLLVYTAGLPFLLLESSFHRHHLRSRAALGQDLFRAQEKVIDSLESSYLDQVSRLQELIRQGFANCAGLDPAGPAFLKPWKAIQSSLQPDFARVLDHRGRRIVGDTESPGRNQGGNPNLEMIIGRLVSNILLPEDPGNPGRADDPLLATLLGDFGGISLEALLDQFRSHLNRLHKYELGQGGSFLFLQPLPVGSSRPVHLAMLGFPNHAIIKALNARIPDFLSVDGIPHRVFFGPRYGPTRPPPADVSFTESFLRLIRLRPQLHQQQIEIGSTTYLLSGRPLTVNRTHFAVVCTDLSTVLAPLADLENRFLVLRVLLLASLCGVAWALGTLFIKPIDQVLGGIDRIRRREFNQAIPVMGCDEFSELGREFNRLCFSLQDLEIAATVQGSLFPKAPLTEKGWQVHGTCHSATEVGGDLFDYLPLRDGCWLILIGDVAGHGVAPALVIGMIKGCLTAWRPHIESGAIKMPDIAERLNHLIREVLGRRRTMTLQFLHFSPHTGTARFVNAGHCFPVRIHEGSPDLLSLPGPLLGARATRPREELETRLTPGDALVLYTDGVIEAFDQEGKQIGYDRFLAATPKLIRPSAVATEQALRVWHQETAPTCQDHDDMTIVILQSISSG
jgi:hypothetical protein